MKKAVGHYEVLTPPDNGRSAAPRWNWIGDLRWKAIHIDRGAIWLCDKDEASLSGETGPLMMLAPGEWRAVRWTSTKIDVPDDGVGE